MAIWALADLHLAFGVPNKNMEAFGNQWIGYVEKIKKNWLAHISPEDLVLIAGDISWATRLEEALVDLEWIHALPGTKVMIRGNHDYWWSSLSKVEKFLPSSLHVIQNNVFNWKNVTVGGSRLWDTSAYSFNSFINYVETPIQSKEKAEKYDFKEAERIFERELGRLELSLKHLNRSADIKIVMTHYPPIGADMHNSQVSSLLEKYGVDICVFGHLHNVKERSLPFGEKNRIQYYLTSCDYLNFSPLKISQ